MRARLLHFKLESNKYDFFSTHFGSKEQRSRPSKDRHQHTLCMEKLSLMLRSRLLQKLMQYVAIVGKVVDLEVVECGALCVGTAARI